MTRESDPRELDQLGDLAMGYNAHNAHNDHRGPEDDTWKQSLANLRRGEAALVPLSVGLRREPGDQHVRFRLAPRRTPHVRHRAKDLDSPVPEGKSFVLEAGASVRRFRTLNGLVSGLETTSAADLHDYLLRHDFSRWIAEVFGDDFMAGKILDVEDEYAMGERPDPNGTLAKLIRDRYELAEEGSATGPASGVASGIASGPAIRE